MSLLKLSSMYGVNITASHNPYFLYRYSLKFTVRNGVLAIRRTYQPEFPHVLDGLVDKRNYFQTVTQVNNIISSIFKKWYYSRGMDITNYITGAFILLPLIPWVILDVKRRHKIFRKIDRYVQDVNSSLPPTANYRWVCEKSPPALKIEFIDATKVSDYHKALLIISAAATTTAVAAAAATTAKAKTSATETATSTSTATAGCATR